MTGTFAQSLTSTFNAALRLMEAALTDCTDDLWQTDLWPQAPTGPTSHGGLHTARLPGSSGACLPGRLGLARGFLHFVQW